MYRHILIPTDGSELAERGVAHGLALAKSLGANVAAVEESHDLGHLEMSPGWGEAQRPFLCWG